MSYTGSLAQSGRGTSISIGPVTGSPPALTLIGEVTDLPFDLPKWETVDITNLESGNDSETLATIRKPATFTIKGNRVSTDAGQTAAITAYTNGTRVPFSIVLPKTATQVTTGDTYTFTGLVLGASFPVSPTKEVSFSLDLMTTGAVVFTAGS
jgi:hypothetical protein